MLSISDFTYPKRLSTIGIGIDAFDRLGPEMYFDDYTVLTSSTAKWTDDFISLKGKVFSLFDFQSDLTLTKHNTESILRETNWQKIKQKLNVKQLLIYKPTSFKDEFESKYGIRLLANDWKLAEKLENKIHFRTIFNSLISIPKFHCLSLDELRPLSFEKLLLRLHLPKTTKIVIQDSILSGGKGTFFINNQDDFLRFIQDVNLPGSAQLIASEFIKGQVGSVQCCVTKNGVISLPPQRQIIENPQLTNAGQLGSEKFNGGQWSPSDYNHEQKEEIKKMASVVGSYLKTIGYKGIFGIDFINAGSRGIFALEINARLTGMTSVIANIQYSLNQIPLLLFHILELSDAPYDVSPRLWSEILEYTFGTLDYGYMILFQNSLETVSLKSVPKSGIYDVLDSRLHQCISSSYVLKEKNTNDVIVAVNAQKNTAIKSGRRLARLLTTSKVLDKRGDLTLQARQLVTSLRELLPITA